VYINLYHMYQYVYQGPTNRDGGQPRRTAGGRAAAWVHNGLPAGLRESLQVMRVGSSGSAQGPPPHPHARVPYTGARMLPGQHSLDVLDAVSGGAGRVLQRHRGRAVL
jgi:hypothetical protein